MGSWLKDRSKILSIDFDVHRKYGGFWRIFLSSEYAVIQLLEYKNFILYSSRPGYNDYNKKVNVWSLIPLKEEDSINSKIIREGLIRGYYNALCDFYYSVSTEDIIGYKLPFKINKDIKKELFLGQF